LIGCSAILTAEPGLRPPARAALALIVLVTMVAAATLELVPMVAAALVAAAVVVATRCLTSDEARDAIEWESLLLIAASFGLARAMEKTGLAEMVAGATIDVAGRHPYALLAAVYLVTMVFTELMSNNAAAVLTFPIAWKTAEDLGVNPMPFVMAVTVAASCGFATPMGYQTNLMIYGPGGYKFSDYLRFGGPLNILVMIITVILAPLLWPF
jgi:di/tricarboxylate transporter